MKVIHYQIHLISAISNYAISNYALTIHLDGWHGNERIMRTIISIDTKLLAGLKFRSIMKLSLYT